MNSKSVRFSAVISVLLASFFLTMLPAMAQTSAVHETTLSNGLKVITKEVHASPVVSFMVWYKVGSRNEQLGKTGLSHLLEHMQFKGTKLFKKGMVDTLIRRNGGIENAATSKDFTYYYETLSSDKLELAMRIESDRMVNSIMDPAEFKSEKTVVRSELEGDENDPESLIYYDLNALAFKAHPYHWPTIGWVHDLESITRDELYRYYKTYYMPNNATVVIVGDFDTAKALSMAQKYFGTIPAGQRPPRVTSLEPVQRGDREAHVYRVGSASRLMMGYHIPAIGNPDMYTLDVIETMLGDGTSSRLYRGLVDSQLATQAWAFASSSKDPDLFILGATARNGVKIDKIQSALLSAVERIKTEPVGAEELQKAINQVTAKFAYMNDSVTEQAQMLGQYETIYSWKYVDTYLDNIKKVTAADVQRVAQKYFTQDNLNIVSFVPEEPKTVQGAESNSAPIVSIANSAPVSVKAVANRSVTSKPAATPVSAGKPTSASNVPSANAEKLKPTRVVLDNGMVVIVLENHSNPIVSIKGSLKAGDMFDPTAKSGIAEMTSELLLKGTTKRTAEQIAAERDYAGMQLDTGSDTEMASFTGQSLPKNFDQMLDILSDSLENPTFPQLEFDKMKSIRLSAIREDEDNPQALAERKFYGMVYPVGHPYHQQSVDEDLASTSAITRDDVLSFYKEHYGPKTAILVVVGDVDTKDTIAKVQKYFGGWSGGPASVSISIPQIPLQTTVQKAVISRPDKSQVNAVFGYASTLKRSDPDFYSASVMNFVLGGGGALDSRMGDVIRDDMGLVYDIYSTFNASLGAGPWLVELGTNPKNTDKAIKSVVQQITLARDKGLKQSEVSDAINFIAGSFPVRLETNSAIAASFHNAEFYGLGMDYIRNYQKIYRSVTLSQVNAAAKKFLHPDRYTLVIAGPYPPKQ